MRNLLPSSQNNDFACHARRALLGIGRVEWSRTSVYPRAHASISFTLFLCLPSAAFFRLPLLHGWRQWCPTLTIHTLSLDVEHARGASAASAASSLPPPPTGQSARPKPCRRTPPLWSASSPSCTATFTSAEVARSDMFGWDPVSL